MFNNPFTKKATIPQISKSGNSQDNLDLTSGMVPEGKGQENKSNKGTSDDPMLKFEELWEPNKDAKGNIIAPANSVKKQFTPVLDPKAMASMMEKMDFTRDFTPEEMTAIVGGGEAAAQAIGTMINKATKRAFLTAFQGSQKMMEHAVQAARQDALAEVPGFVRDSMIDSELSKDNVLMTNPAYAPMVKTIKKQFQDKYPKASPAEINKGVRAYFDKMVQDMNKSTAKVEEVDNENLLTKGDANADWQEWFDVELPAVAENTQGNPQNLDTNTTQT